MTERLYNYLEITDLKDMLNKTKELYSERPAYKIRIEKEKYKIFTHKEVREMVDSLGTALINLGLKGKRIGIIGQNRYEWEIAYLSIVCGTGIVVPLDKSLPENELESLIERSEIEAIFYLEKYEEYLKRIQKGTNNKLKYLISMELEKHSDGIYSQKELIEEGKRLIENGNKKFINAKINPEEMSIMLFTSGTTSQSKVVALSHKNICSNLMDLASMVDIDSNDTLLSILPIHHVFKISNSIDKEKILKLSKEEINIPNIPTFSIMGRLDNNKNQILLLKAARILAENRKDFRVYILGEGNDRKSLQRYIEKHGLKKNVKILGFKDNPYPYIKNSVATVTTSLSEGFSLVLVESLFLNTPIISTDVGVARELIENYNCGDLIDYNEKMLADVMLKYIEKYDENKNKPEFNIGKDFSLQKELEETIEVIEKTIEKENNISKMKQLPYPVERINYEELKEYQIKEDLLYILEVEKDNVKYEYLINRKLDNDKLIVFNNGAVAGGKVKVPVFQRHSWANELKTSSILCMDPTLYINDLSVGWGVGKNENYYLENSSLILKQIIEKMNIELKDTVIYGTSAGGFLSIMMGIYLKGVKVVADNSQLILSNWIVKPALDSVIFYCFDNIADSLNHLDRFDIIEAFRKHNYVPKIYLHVNMCSEADNSKQLVPFLTEMEKVKGIKNYQDIEVTLHYEETKGHEGLNKDEALKFLYNVLDVYK